jgi:integrase
MIPIETEPQKGLDSTNGTADRSSFHFLSKEAVGLQVEDLRGAVLHVRHGHWNGKLYTPKTDAGIREVDIHSSLASLLHEHIGTRTTGFVFQSSRGTPLARSNVLRRSLHKILQEMGSKKSGFHGFRRYHDRRTIPPLLKVWAEEERTHGGVIFVDEKTISPADIGRLVRALISLAGEAGEMDWTNQVYFLRSGR